MSASEEHAQEATRRKPRKSTRLLTDDLARTIPPPRTGRKEIWHEHAHGLVLRITSNDARSWAVTFKVRDAARAGQRGGAVMGIKGTAQRITLGPVQKITLKQAVDQADKIFELANSGVDPRVPRAAENEDRRVNTVKSVAERMINSAKKVNRSWKVQETALRLHVYPRIGDRPIVSVTRKDVFDLLDDLKAKKSIATAREARKHLGRVMNWAANRTIIPVNPMAGLEDEQLVYVSRDRVLTDMELRAAWIAADALGYPYGPALKLLILTGQREREILHAAYRELDLKERLLKIPKARHKTKRGQSVPFSQEAWEIFEGLPRRAGSDHLFVVANGNVAGKNGISSIQRKHLKLTKAEMLKVDPKFDFENWKHFTWHDMRRTCETRLASLKVPQERIDRVIGHAKKGMAGTYNHYEYLDEKREALDKYAAHVMAVVR